MKHVTGSLILAILLSLGILSSFHTVAFATPLTFQKYGPQVTDVYFHRIPGDPSFDTNPACPAGCIIGQIVAGSGYGADAMAFDSANNDLYVSYQNGEVAVISTSTNTVDPCNCTFGGGGGPWPSGMAYDPSNNYVYVANPNLNYINVVSGTSTIGTIQVGSGPTAIAYSPSNNDVYVDNSRDNTVSVISSTDNSVIATISVGQDPHGIVFVPYNNDIYVSNGNSNSLSIISTTTNTVVQTVNVTLDPVGLAFDPLNNDVYVPNQCPGGCPGAVVSVISAVTNTLVANITNLTPGPCTPGPLCITPTDASFASSNGDVYVTDFGANSLAVISSTNNVVATVATPPNCGPDVALFVPTNNETYVGCQSGPSIQLLGTTTDLQDQMVNNGTSDFMMTPLSAADLNTPPAPGVTREAEQESLVWQIEINNGMYPTNITGFRAAIALLFDRNTFQKMLGNQGQLTNTTLPAELKQMISPTPYPYQYNTTKAAEILDGLGFTVGPNGTRIDPRTGTYLHPLIFYVRTASFNGATPLPLVKAMGDMETSALRSIGIPVNVTYTNDITTLLDTVFSGQAYNLYTGGWYFGYVTPDNILDDLYVSRNIPPNGDSSNYINFSNSTYDAIADDIRSFNGTVRNQAIMAAQDILSQQAVIIPVYSGLTFKDYRSSWHDTVSQSYGGYEQQYLFGGTSSYWNFLNARNNSTNVLNTAWLSKSDGTQLTPFTNDVGDSVSFSYVLQLIYDPLIQIDPFNSSNAFGWLADNYTVGPRPGGLPGTRLTFNIHPGVNFTDGTPLTANDVKFSVQYFQQNPTASYTIGSDVINVTTSGSYTVNVDDNITNYWLLYTIGSLPILPMHIWQNVTYPFNFNPIAKNALIGSGPFMLNQTSPDLVHLSRNPNYFRSAFSATLHSPANLYVVDPLGHVVGVDPDTGTVVNQIPGAIFSGKDTEPETILIVEPVAGQYKLEVIGTATGNYTLSLANGPLTETIRGTTAVGQTGTFTVNGQLSEAQPVPGFSYQAAIASPSITINPGMSANYQITTTLSSGTSTSVFLGVSGLPPGASADFTPTTITPSGTANLTISTSPSVPTGNYSLTITTSGGGVTETLPATLNVQAASVGGEIVPIDKLSLTAPYAEVASLILVSIIGFRLSNRSRNEKSLKTEEQPAPATRT